MKKFEFNTPEYLLCEIGRKDGSHNDDRLWVYCVKSLTLLEFVCADDWDEVYINYTREFQHINNLGEKETWLVAIVQNNAELADKNIEEVLDGAIRYFENYLIFEDDEMSDF